MRKELCEKYDEILYIDFDVIPNTTENFFEVFNVSEYIPVKATIPYNPKIATEYIEIYEKTITAVTHNQYVKKYYDGINENFFHGKPWVAEKYPGEFEKKYNLEWWFKQVRVKSDPFYGEDFVKEGYRPEDIEPWDDGVKYAAIDILTEGKAIFYNTGVMGFCSDTLNQLNIFEDFVDWGRTTSECASWFRRFSNHRGAVRGANDRNLRLVLTKLGIDYVPLHVYPRGKGPTLARWLRENKEKRTPGRVYLIIAGNHYQLVTGRRYACGRIGAIVSIKDKGVKRRARVTYVWELVIRDKLTIPEPQYKKPTYSKERAKSYRLLKEYGEAHDLKM